MNKKGVYSLGDEEHENKIILCVNICRILRGGTK